MFKVIHPPPPHLTPNLPDVVLIKYFLNPTGHVGFNPYFFHIALSPAINFYRKCEELNALPQTLIF